MKTKKLLRRIGILLSADQRAQIEKYDSLEKVLEKLKKKEVALRQKLEGEEGKREQREIVRKLEVVEAQRKKGVKLRKEIERLRDSE